uniref:Uncharacterized protein n=1 Tax=Manihot esculenta TaxID=3983 RepID=A0A2C9W5X7_MANES
MRFTFITPHKCIAKCTINNSNGGPTLKYIRYIPY